MFQNGRKILTLFTSDCPNDYVRAAWNWTKIRMWLTSSRLATLVLLLQSGMWKRLFH